MVLVRGAAVALIASGLMLGGCSSLPGLPGMGGNTRDAASAQTGIGVNAYLWRATLDTLSFMPLANADPLDVQSQMSVTYPYEGAVVTGSFVAEGVNNGNEATMNWRIENATGDSVLEGYATAEGWMDGLYPWQTDPIDVSGLAPGRYTFVAVNPDESDGEGFPPDTDTRSITVE